jgi:hypothetical protein
MGMFDYIIVDAQQLPVSPSERELLKNKNFQTKDLENCLLSYEITNEGEIMLQNIKDEKTLELISYFREMMMKNMLKIKTLFVRRFHFTAS